MIVFVNGDVFFQVTEPYCLVVTNMGKKNTVYYLHAASKWIVTLYPKLVCSKILRTKMLWHSLFVFHFSCPLFELACRRVVRASAG